MPAKAPAHERDSLALKRAASQRQPAGGARRRAAARGAPRRSSGAGGVVAKTNIEMMGMRNSRNSRRRVLHHRAGTVTAPRLRLRADNTSARWGGS